MNKWFYEQGGTAVGPLSTPEMHALIEQGACTRTTLVWTRGMKDWLPACMAAWMWERREDRHGSHGSAEGSGDGSADGAAAEPRSGEAMARSVGHDGAGAESSGDQHAATEAQAAPANDEASNTVGDAPNAGVAGMVRKLFGLG